MKRLLVRLAVVIIAVAFIQKVWAQTIQKVDLSTAAFNYIGPDTLKGLGVGVGASLQKDSMIFLAIGDKYLWRGCNGKWVQLGPSNGLNLTYGAVISLAKTESGDILVGSFSGIHKSTDNGESWHLVFSKRTITTIFRSRTGVMFAGGGGIGTGIYQSADNGETWTSGDSLLSTPSSFWGFVELPSGILLVASENSNDYPNRCEGIFRSTDGGNKWVHSNTGLPNLNVESIAASPSGDIIYAVTYLDGSCYSTDEGLTWSAVVMDASAPKHGGVAFVSPNLGAYIGLITFQHNSLYQSTDKKNWKAMSISGYAILGIVQLDSVTLGLSTDDGFWSMKFSGTTDVVESNPTLPKGFALSQNYPNPFNPSTTIQFSLPSRTNVNLVIYNTIGQKIETIVSGELNAGTHQYVWNAGKYSSGIYFYRLETNNFVQTKKMLLVK